MQLLLATQNQAKAQELRSILSTKGWDVVTPDQVMAVRDLDVVEDGETIEANAIKKAKGFAELAQMLALADDTGLEVVSLNGEPGVHAKRYGTSTNDRNQKVLAALSKAAAAGKTDRQARFVTCIAIYDPSTDKTHTFHGELRGHIAMQEADVPIHEGVGYDTIFIPEGYDATLAELGNVIKQQVSHRRQALDRAVAFLESQDARR